MFQKMMMKKAAKGVLNTYSACLERAREEHKSQHGSDPETKAEAIACAYQAQEWAAQVYAGMRNPKMSEFWRNCLSEHTGNVVANIQAGNLPEGGAEPTREAKAKPVDPFPELTAHEQRSTQDLGFRQFYTAVMGHAARINEEYAVGSDDTDKPNEDTDDE